MVTLPTSAVLMTSVLLSFPSISIIQRFGIDLSTKIAMILLAVGLGGRALINLNFYSVLIGQIVVGLGFPIIANIQGKFITIWFDEKERGLWIAICTMANPLGTLFSFLLPIIMIDFKEMDKDKGKIHVFYYFLVQGIGAGVVALATLILWKRGKSRETVLVLQKQENGEEILGDLQNKAMPPIWAQIKHIFSRFNVLLIIFNYGLGFGIIISLGGQIPEIFNTIGISQV